ARVIACDVGCELLRELLELTLLGRPQPARGDDVYRLERALDAVLAFQPEGRDVELERADGTENQIVVHERPEKLRRTFLAELRETLLERLQLQRVAQHGAPEQLRREIRDAGEDERLPLAEAVADVDGAVIVEADDVARVCLGRALPVGRHERDRVADPDLPAEARVIEAHAGPIRAAADAHERDPVAVRRIHVRLDLEYEAGQSRLVRAHDARRGGARLRRRRVADERVEQLLHAEVVDRRAEEDGRLLAREIARVIERRRRAADQLDLFLERLRDRLAERVAHLGGAEPRHAVRSGRAAAVPILIEVRAILEQVIDAAELAAHADRPRHGRALDVEDRLDLVEQLERLAPVAVELVHEAHDRRRAEPADLHQLDRSRLDALRRIDHHQRAVDRRQRPIRVLREILVARRIEQVHDGAAVRELHDGRRDRDAALLLELDRKSTRLNSSHVKNSYAVFCSKKNRCSLWIPLLPSQKHLDCSASS